MANTTAEKIEVMIAYNEGKKIECKDNNFDSDWIEWVLPQEPAWDWAKCDYRVKEKPKYRPYKDTEEMINDFCKRFRVKRTNYGEPFIWIRLKKNKISKHIITDIYEDGIYLSSDYVPLESLFDQYTYLDGSPIGKKE